MSVAAGHGPLDGRLELVELESSRTTGELPVSCQCILLLYICADRDSELRISNGWHQAGWRCGDIDWLVTWSLLAEDRFEPAGGSPEFPGRRDHTTELPRQLVQDGKLHSPFDQLIQEIHGSCSARQQTSCIIGGAL